MGKLLSVLLPAGVRIGFVLVLAVAMQQRIESQPTEYLLKGIFLEKFTRFIEWPLASGVEDTTRPFILGVIGKNPFNGFLNQLYQNQRIKNKKVLVEYFNTPDEIDDCNLLFIARSEQNRISEILEKTKTRPILTIGDSDFLSARGVIINLQVRNKKIRFEINEKAARLSKLYISHLLLKEATIIDPDGSR